MNAQLGSVEKKPILDHTPPTYAYPEGCNLFQRSPNKITAFTEIIRITKSGTKEEKEYLAMKMQEARDHPLAKVCPHLWMNFLQLE